jgi:hypothetical protein
MNSFKQGGYSEKICNAIQENWQEWGNYSHEEIEQYCSLYTKLFILITNRGYTINEAVKKIKNYGH